MKQKNFKKKFMIYEEPLIISELDKSIAKGKPLDVCETYLGGGEWNGFSLEFLAIVAANFSKSWPL